MRVLPEAPSQTMWRRRVRISLDSVDTARFSSWCSSAPTYAVTATDLIVSEQSGMVKTPSISTGESGPIACP